jgi:hypothetical protein
LSHSSSNAVAIFALRSLELWIGCFINAYASLLVCYFQIEITGSRLPQASVSRLSASDGNLGDKAAVIDAAATDREKLAIELERCWFGCF